MRQIWTLVAALVVVVGGTPGARAGLVTFTYGQADLNVATVSKTVDGITLTLSDPSPSSILYGDDLGIYVTDLGPGTGPNTFTLAVTGGTIGFSGYNVGYAAGTPGSFALTGGSGTSTGNLLGTTGDKTANGNWQLAPGETGIFTLTGANGGLVQIRSLTFNVVPAAAVPEPGTVGLALVGAGVLGVRAWRRRGLRAAA